MDTDHLIFIGLFPIIVRPMALLLIVKSVVQVIFKIGYFPNVEL